MPKKEAESVDWMAQTLAEREGRERVQVELGATMRDAAIAQLEQAGYMRAFERSDIPFGGAIRLQLWRRTGRLVSERLDEAVALVARGASPADAATVVGAATIGRELVDEMIEYHQPREASASQPAPTPQGMTP